MTHDNLTKTDARNESQQREYSEPQIVHELELETRAGSPLGVPNPLDPAGVDPAE